jgi:hypothetical protein
MITELLDRLNPVHTAFYNHIEAPACLEGTRVQLLDDIERWLTDPDSKTVFWLTGPAGTGKTTVARSVAEMANRRNCLGATFFFSRTSDDRSDLKNVIPTIAHQLARDPRLRSRIVAAMDADNSLVTADVATQAEDLLLEALRVPVSESPTCLLLVFDALDECKKGRNGVHGGDLIPHLLDAVKDAPFVKVFLTSRPESSIETMFIDAVLDGTTHTLALHRDIEENTVQSDITHYLSSELSKLRKRIPNNPTFPDNNSIHTLVERAGTLFIYARTAVEYISNPIGRPDRRLASLIQAKPELSSQQYSSLDKLYSQILRTAHDSFHCGDLINDSLRIVLVALVLAREEISLNELVTVTGVDQDLCGEILRMMSAILNHQHGVTEPVRLMHTSFSDFISNRLRCSELPGYTVSPSRDHMWFTDRCIEALIERLSISKILNGDLEAQMQAQVREFWLYSCRFWAEHWLEHLRESGVQNTVPQGLKQFCTLYLPRWIHVVSLINRRDSFDALVSAVQAFSALQVSLFVIWSHFECEV